MGNITRRGLMAATGSTAAVAGLVSGIALRHGSIDRHEHLWQKIPARELIRRRHLPNVELITHDGARVRFYDDLIRDRKVVINFMFTNCEKACPLITTNLVRVQKMLKDRIGHDIFMYSISLKPEDDTPEVLKQYAKAHGIGPGWVLLTGNVDDVEWVRHALGFVSLNPVRDADKTTHIGMLRYGNEPYMRWAACPGQAPPDWIAVSILSEMDGPLKGGLKQKIAT